MRPIFVIHNNIRSSKIVSTLIAEHMNFDIKEINISELDDINQMIINEDAALLVIGLNDNKEIQLYLNKCRELRVPYIFVKNNISQEYNIETITLPITNLEEEKEKGPYCSSIARHFNSNVIIYQPKDYGSKAEININAVKTLFNSLDVKYNTKKGKKDSSNIELEACRLKNNDKNNILIISASRDYGLDDLIFGPKEKKIIKEATMPIMLINPRGDLYALCD